jgi:hypothetical protein
MQNDRREVMSDNIGATDVQQMMDHRDILQMRLAELRRQHRTLDSEIAALSGNAAVEALGMRRLKKQKLALKDHIAKIEDQLTPDIIA